MAASSRTERDHGLRKPVIHSELDDVESHRGVDENDLLSTHPSLGEVRQKSLVRKVDLRLCTIAGILCSLNLVDSGIISSASVTTIFQDLDLGVGNRYVGFLPYKLDQVVDKLLVHFHYDIHNRKSCLPVACNYCSQSCRPTNLVHIHYYFFWNYHGSEFFVILFLHHESVD